MADGLIGITAVWTTVFRQTYVAKLIVTFGYLLPTSRFWWRGGGTKQFLDFAVGIRIRLICHKEQDRQCTYSVTLRSVRVAIVFMPWLSGMQSACVPCLALPYFSTLSQTARFSVKKLLDIKCIFWFSLQILSETFFILRRTQRDIVTNIHTSPCKVPVIVVWF